MNFRYDVTGNNLINTSDVGVVRGLGTLTLLGLPEPTVPPPPRGGNPLPAEAVTVADAAASLDAREFPPLVRQSLGEQRRFSDKWLVTMRPTRHRRPAFAFVGLAGRRVFSRRSIPG